MSCKAKSQGTREVQGKADCQIGKIQVGKQSGLGTIPEKNIVSKRASMYR